MPLQLSLDDAIRRGEQFNLGILLQQAQTRGAAGSRLEQLQKLLPTVDAKADIGVQQVNLKAEGISLPHVSSILGPFQVTDFRATLGWQLVNVSSLESYLAAKHDFAAAQQSEQDTRDMVVLAVGNGYLLCVADVARVTAMEAEFKTAELSVEQATAAHDAGTSPRLDVLRAQVDRENANQRLIVARNQMEKDRLALGRAIGLQPEQEFVLTDTAPFTPLDGVDVEKAVAAAQKNRKDLQAADEQVLAAQARRKAAVDSQLPMVGFQGDFGDIGTTASHSHGTYTATGTVSSTALQVVKTRGDIESADAQLKAAQARRDDLYARVDQEVRVALLDIASAAKLVEATKSNAALADETLGEAQERYKAGVADNLAVSEAQSVDEQASDAYIAALYRHNMAKLSLARALGVAATSYKDYFGGKQP